MSLFFHEVFIHKINLSTYMKCHLIIKFYLTQITMLVGNFTAFSPSLLLLLPIFFLLLPVLFKRVGQLRTKLKESGFFPEEEKKGKRKTKTFSVASCQNDFGTIPQLRSFKFFFENLTKSVFMRFMPFHQLCHFCHSARWIIFHCQKSEEYRKRLKWKKDTKRSFQRAAFQLVASISTVTPREKLVKSIFVSIWQTGEGLMPIREP